MLRRLSSVVLPEEDDGFSYQGRYVASASLWVPRERIQNLPLLLRVACITGQIQKEDVTISLVKEKPYHVLLPLRLRTNLLRDMGEPEVITRNIQHERIRFEDGIIPRSAKQSLAWEAFEQSDFGILNVACGGGKTTLGLKKIAQRGGPALVFVNNGGLAQQWVERAKQFLGLTDAEIGIVQGDRAEWDRPLVIAMLQTVVSRADTITPAIRRRFATVLYDEVQHMAAQTFVTTADMFYGARYGLTATVERSDKLEGVYLAHLGPVFYSDVTSEVYADVYFKRTPFVLQHHVQLESRSGDLIISRLYTALATMARRNEMIISDVVDAAKSGRKILVLTHSVEHTATMQKLLAKRAPQIVSGIVTGAVKDTKRAPIMHASTVIFATFNIAKEGLDIPALDSLFITTPFKDWGAFQQCKGRVERKYDDKLKPMVVVYDDTQIDICAALCAILRRGMKLHGLKFSTLGEKAT